MAQTCNSHIKLYVYVDLITWYDLPCSLLLKELADLAPIPTFLFNLSFRVWYSFIGLGQGKYYPYICIFQEREYQPSRKLL